MAMGLNVTGFSSLAEVLSEKGLDGLGTAVEILINEAMRIERNKHWCGLIKAHHYGSRRIKKALNALGYPVGIRKTKSLMKEAGVFVRYRKKYKITTNSNHKKPLFENVLNRQFNVAGPDLAYVSDITYINTKEGWLYLAVVIDLFSRKVVGWSMSSRMKASLVCDALKMAIWQRKPKRGLIVHSDRGSQYASHEYKKLLEQHGYIGSMSRKGNCWDNAVAESFLVVLNKSVFNGGII